MARNLGRGPVVEFVQTWLAHHQQWVKGKFSTIEVAFPSELTGERVGPRRTE